MTEPQPVEAETDKYEWVGSNDHGLAHLSWESFDYDYSVCGISMIRPSLKKGRENPRCTICADISEGRLDPHEFM
jgi:hypothetical protein